MKHSPSPWTIDGGFDAGIDVGIIDAGGNEILAVPPFDGEDLDEWGEQSLGNAHLIAAAPDLYAALEEQLQFTPGGPCQVPLVPICRCSDCKNMRARAALAKARGESPK